MFWKKKKTGKQQPETKEKKLDREALLAQARANAAAAREQIGDETLEKIKEAMLKKENNPFEQAKRKVQAMDQDKVRDHLSLWMREKE